MKNNFLRLCICLSVIIILGGRVEAATWDDAISLSQRESRPSKRNQPILPQFKVIWLEEVKRYGVELRSLPSGRAWQELSVEKGDVLLAIDARTIKNPFLLAEILLEALHSPELSSILLERKGALHTQSINFEQKKRILAEFDRPARLQRYLNAARLQASFFSSFTVDEEAVSISAILSALKLAGNPETAPEIRRILTLSLSSLEIYDL